MFRQHSGRANRRQGCVAYAAFQFSRTKQSVNKLIGRACAAQVLDLADQGRLELQSAYTPAIVAEDEKVERCLRHTFRFSSYFAGAPRALYRGDASLFIHTL